jgi:predicted enzyme related to lactoylglutathione lyase
MALAITTAFVAIATPHMDRAIAFYQALLGQPPQPYQPGRYGEFHLPGLRLGVFTPRADHRSEFQAPSSGPMSLCLEVDDLEAAIAQVTALGYGLPGDVISASHGREVYATDPDGNRLILHSAGD